MKTISIPTEETLYTPYYNEWNLNRYTRTKPFKESPWDISASSTSGCSVAITKGHFVGLTRICDATFDWDGSQLTVTAPEDALFHQRFENVEDAWSSYHKELQLPELKAPFGKLPEYGTWLEQIFRKEDGKLPGDALTPALIDELLDRVDASGWPKGRFTVDEGWGPRHGPGGYATYAPHPNFDMAAIAQKIKDRGHVPGLWLAPPLVCPNSDAAKRWPGLVGKQVDMGGETPWNKFHFVKPGPESYEMIEEMFQKTYAWGYRKYKLDIYYGNKRDMAEISKQCFEVVSKFPEPVELEAHIPDALVAQYSHIVRVNDVLISKHHPEWRQTALGHFKVCRESTPQHTLCLDYVGGNDPRLTDEEMDEHIEMVRKELPHGYPCVGLHRYHFKKEVADNLSRLLHES